MESKSKNCIGTKVYSFFLYHDKSRERVARNRFQLDFSSLVAGLVDCSTTMKLSFKYRFVKNIVIEIKTTTKKTGFLRDCKHQSGPKKCKTLSEKKDPCKCTRLDY